MAEEQITYKDLPAEHNKKYDELKAICEAELIGSFETTRSHNIKLKGDTRSSHGVNTSSHSRGKDKEEAVPRDRPQDDDRRYLTEEEVRSIRYQRPLSVHLLNKYEQQYDRRRRYDEDDERYRRFDADRRDARSIIEHRLPLKKGFRPFQQRARQMKAEILEEVKKEIKKMLDAGFIRPCRYAEWISNVVPVEKKDGRWRVAIDFRNLNSATPKDEYPMP
ncbi:hypothetical protein QYE76_053269 [Lolium multiflorum]|uniref:Uncharacterized protein n=1 Tax=Lolium multiflorum TaxID=4521 RepID=A0AAD8WMD2_LOLMU|nr:hypothetical protein QYE76_053269 [Lolium multiflorum]